MLNDSALDAAVAAADVYNPGRDPNCLLAYKEINRERIKYAVKAAKDFNTRKDPDLDWRVIDAMVKYQQSPEKCR
jgi:hypothetical protein